MKTDFPKVIAIVIADEAEANSLIALVAGRTPVMVRQGLFTPAQRVAVRILASLTPSAGECMVCGCTDDDCAGCVARTGEPCAWINLDHTICSACIPPEVVLPVL